MGKVTFEEAVKAGEQYFDYKSRVTKNNRFAEAIHFYQNHSFCCEDMLSTSIALLLPQLVTFKETYTRVPFELSDNKEEWDSILDFIITTFYEYLTGEYMDDLYEEVRKAWKLFAEYIHEMWF